MKRRILLFLLLVSLSRCFGQNGCGATKNWTDPSCQTINAGALSSAWTVISRHGEYTQQETECNIPSEVSVSNGLLNIKTEAVAYTCGDFNTNGAVRTSPQSFPYSTGDVQWNTFNFKNGTIIVRAKAPASNTNTWPSFWLLGSNCQNTNKYSGDTISPCPTLGAASYIEIDMLECYNSGGWCQFHVANPNFGIGNGCDVSYAVDTNFHVWELVWGVSSISLYMDNSLITTCNQNLNGNLFFIAQTQTGGVGGTPSNANLPTTFSLDYVKVCNSSLTKAQCDAAASTDAGVIFFDDFVPAVSTPPAPATPGTMFASKRRSMK